MAEQQGGAETTEGGQHAKQPLGHRRPPRRCDRFSTFPGVAAGFRTPSSDRFHWFVLSELDDLGYIVERIDDEPGVDDA